MSTPLTDAINALTTYANSVTGASDTTLSDAVDTLVAGYGGGGSAEGISIDWPNITLVTIGANSVSNMGQAADYFKADHTPCLVVLKESPTINNQFVFCSFNTNTHNIFDGLRYRNGTIQTSGTSSSYDTRLIEGTHYYVFELK